MKWNKAITKSYDSQRYCMSKIFLMEGRRNKDRVVALFRWVQIERQVPEIFQASLSLLTTKAPKGMMTPAASQQREQKSLYTLSFIILLN